MESFEKKKRNSLTLSDKVAIIQDLKERSATKAELARRFNVHRSTIRKIEKKSDSILEVAANKTGRKRKHWKYAAKGKYRQLEEALFFWFLNQRRLRRKVTTMMLVRKAKLFAPQFGIPNTVRFSEHWSHNFKIRYGIRKLKVCGESLSCDVDSIESFREKFFEEIASRNLTAEMIYNADESGLFFRMLPGETLVAPQEKSAPGHKVSKLRVTFMPCCNVTGSHKLPMVVIGKSRNPRAMKNVRVPVTYLASKNAWMTRALFKEWFFKHFVPAVRRYAAKHNISPSAILLLDNCSAHHFNDKLESDDGLITVFFLPPNVTAMIQPMDQNVIQNVKLRYREKLLLETMGMDQDEDAEERLAKVNMKDVCFWLHEAWDAVEAKVIRQSWRKIGIIEGDLLMHEDDLPLAKLFNIPTESAEEIAPHDVEERYSCKVLSDDDVVNLVLHDEDDEENDRNLEPKTEEPKPMDEDEEENDWNMECTAEDPKSKAAQQAVETDDDIVSNTEAVNHLEKVINWAEQSKLPMADILYLRRLRESALMKCVGPTV